MSHVSVVRRYQALRPVIIDRLVELRAGLDPVLARASVEDARSQLERVVDQYISYVATGDQTLHRGFLLSFLAMRAAQAQGPASALGTLVAVGDIAAQIALEQSGDSATEAEPAEVVAAMAAATLATARMMNSIMASELDARRRELAKLSGGHS